MSLTGCFQHYFLAECIDLLQILLFIWWSLRARHLYFVQLTYTDNAA